jgi:hypothetical protein
MQSFQCHILSVILKISKQYNHMLQNLVMLHYFESYLKSLQHSMHINLLEPSGNFTYDQV